MKKGIVFLLLAVSFTAHSQKLKDLLYSGKLKSDSNTVVRSTDDLSTKIDTAQKKPADTAKLIAVIPGDSIAKAALPARADKVAHAAAGTDSAVQEAGVTEPVTGAEPIMPVATTPVKSNNKIWKEYIDSLQGSLKTEVLTNKKVKKETYYMMVEYELGTDNQVSILNVMASPENTFLQEQVKERILYNPPQLNPVLDGNNQPKKVKRKYSFTITKE